MQVLNKYKHTPTPTAIYIGRGSIYGNPFAISERQSRLAVIEMFEDYFLERMVSDLTYREAVLVLQGHDLVCFCAPQQCHGDIYVNYFNGVYNQPHGLLPVW